MSRVDKQKFFAVISSRRGRLLAIGFWLFFALNVSATPANRAALAKHFDKFLAGNLNRCTTCHLPSEIKNPESLDQFPHNPFGARLRAVGKELVAAGKKKDIPSRLALIASEDSDGDGVDNLTELLLGHAPGDRNDKPTEKELAEVKKRKTDFEKFLAGYRWQPFEPVKRPAIPVVKNKKWIRNPIDAFIAAEHEARKLKPRPEASKPILLRRVYLDLIGLAPTPLELRDFENDHSPDAYEKIVDRLLADSRYGERWARHWMDIWRYSDWAGYNAEVRDSKPHIWRWRDWIVESLNEDKTYDRMIQEMLAADELYPENTNALRATGFLVRNYKLFSRDQWLTDTVQHTSKAFLGITMNCCKCHDHKFDPISQSEYYEMRAIFEPHFIRTDRIPGQYDTAKDGLVRVFDVETNTPTYIFIRGDERNPDTNSLIQPGVPAIFGGSFKLEPVKLPRFAAFPDKRPFVIPAAIAAAKQAVADAKKDGGLALEIAEARETSLLATLKAEDLDDAGKKKSEEWKKASTDAVSAQRKLAVLEGKQQLNETRDKEKTAKEKADKKSKEAEDAEKTLKDANDIAVVKIAAEKLSQDLQKAKEKTAEDEKALAKAEKENSSPPDTKYKPSSPEIFPEVSTGRRSAFARWLTDSKNPLTARVAMNHLWLRHFGRAIVETTSNFGRNGRDPTHPQLLDWLAAEFMAQNWSMKTMHRLIVTSSTYRMASTFDKADGKIDRENIFLWRMNSRRMEAEAVRDNLLYVGGTLDLKMGGPEIPAAQGLISKRRSVYLRTAGEKEVEFLKIFDGADPVECYERKTSVMPHQALALANSELASAQSKLLADEIFKRTGDNDKKFITEAFLHVLAREPNRKEIRECGDFLKQQTKWLVKAKPESSGEKSDSAGKKSKSKISEKPSAPAQRAREDLVLVLFNHNDFVTIR